MVTIIFANILYDIYIELVTYLDLSDVVLFFPSALFNWTSESSSFGIPKPKAVAVAPSEHEQVDGTVLATCITGTSSKDSLLSWIRHLENANPSLVGTPVVFQLRSQEGGIEIWREATPEQQVVPSDRWK